MLYLETRGYGYSQRRCEDVVFWFVKKYLPRHKLDITVNHRGLLREGVHGLCTAMDSDYRPREFEIEMHNRLDVDKYFTILLHELWHVYQYVNGYLRNKHGKRLWEGIDHSETDYDNQPWEQQAYQMETNLFNEYLTTSEKRV